MLQRVDKLGFDEGLRATIADITADLTPSSLNAMLLSDGALTALSLQHRRRGLPRDDRARRQARGAARLLRPAVPPARGRDAGRLQRLGRRRVVGRMDNGTAMVLPAGGGSPRTVEVGRYPEAAAARATKKRLTGEL